MAALDFDCGWGTALDCGDCSGAALDCDDASKAALDDDDGKGTALDGDCVSESANGLTGDGYFSSFTRKNVGAVGGKAREYKYRLDQL